MKYKRLGDYIQPVNNRNKELEITTLLGVSIKKVLMPSIANTIGTNMKTYKIIEKNQFAYGPVTSRNGDKISIALLEDYEKAIVSQAYTVFETIDEQEVLPQYLMMWFRRPEFDRFARFKSHGSAREVFDWEELCDTQLPIPSIEKQQQIVDEYNTVTNRIQLNEKINTNLEATAQALYKHWFVDFNFPYSPPQEGCPQDGVVKKRNSKNYFNLPYNPKLKERAKALRKAGNLAEVLFWQQVKNKQFKGLDFDRQKIIGNYIVDFYCPNLQLVVEIDGSSHDNKQEYDAIRDAYLQELGLTVIHITDKDVKNQLDATMRWLHEHKVFKDVDKPPRLSGTPPTEGNLGYKSSGGEMVYNEELDKEIPVGWSVESVKDFSVDMKSGATPDRSEIDYWNSNDYSWIKTGELKNSVIINSEESISALGLKNSSTKLLPINSVLIAMYGQGNTKGQVGYLKIEATTNQACCAMICEDENHSTFLYYHLRVNRDEIVKDAIGGAQPNLSKELIEKISIIKPSKDILLKTPFIEILNSRWKISLESQKLKELQSLLLAKMTQVEPKTQAV